MAKGQYHRSRSRSQGRASPFAWFVAGLLAGAGLLGLVWLKAGSSDAAPGGAGEVAAPDPRPADSPPRPKERFPDDSQAPRFEYYSVLPEMEVVIPPEELSAPRPVARAPRVSESPPPVTAARAPAPPPAPAAEKIYLLQMGAFRGHADADRLKASVALLGISARIEKVTINDRGTYYRVRSGPYGRKQAEGLHAKLRRNKMDSQVIRVRK
ncbi:MAG: SPOR domain-containing protein [Pseudomonadota bacterium]